MILVFYDMPNKNSILGFCTFLTFIFVTDIHKYVFLNIFCISSPGVRTMFQLFAKVKKPIQFL